MCKERPRIAVASCLERLSFCIASVLSSPFGPSLPLQFELYKSLLEPLVGVPLANIKRYEFNWNDRRLFKVDTLYQVSISITLYTTSPPGTLLLCSPLFLN